MKAQTVFALAAAMAAALFAEEPKGDSGIRAEGAGRSAEQSMNADAMARRRLMRGGGMLFRRGEGGSIRFLDMRRDRTPSLAAEAEHVSRFTTAWADVAEVEPAEGRDGFRTARDVLATNEEVRIAIAVVEEGADAPTLLVCPEDRVAVLNVDRLRVDLPADNPGAFASRLKKEIWRAVAFAADGFDIDYPCVLKAVASPSDIDAIEMEMFCPPVSAKVARYARKVGVAPLRMYPYAAAVKQGWAPAPTNDVQRAIWDAVRAQTATNAPAGAANR